MTSPATNTTPSLSEISLSPRATEGSGSLGVAGSLLLLSPNWKKPIFPIVGGFGIIARSSISSCTGDAPSLWVAAALRAEALYAVRSGRPMIHLIRKSCLAGAMFIALSAAAAAQPQSIVLDRDGSTIVFEPYAPNIIRVTLSMLKEPATDAPGYGFVARPSAQGWSRQGDVYRSSRLVVTLEPNHAGTPLPRFRWACALPGSRPAACWYAWAAFS